mmetsp:Transcript_5681/g.11139  ORF Transcript_5681/g.11139 Transcript_5681/m.11139 type:complete len:239 (-) Transcript_5681:85-801(-)
MVESNSDNFKSFEDARKKLRVGIKKIDVSNTRFSDMEDEFSLLMDDLGSNSTCKSLSLYGCEIDDEGAGKVADCLIKNSSLTSLDLGNNDFNLPGVTKLADALDENLTLVNLNLMPCNVDSEEEAMKRIDKMTKRNKNIEELKKDNPQATVHAGPLGTVIEFPEETGRQESFRTNCRGKWLLRIFTILLVAAAAAMLFYLIKSKQEPNRGIIRLLGLAILAIFACLCGYEQEFYKEFC